MDVLNVFSLIIAVFSFAFSLFTYILSVLQDKKKATIDAFNLLQVQALDEINGYQKNKIKKIAQNPHSPEYKKISAIIARIEHFCVGVNSGIYDKKVVKRLAGIYLISVYEKVKPLIIKKREIFKTDRHYYEFERLAKTLGRMYNKYKSKSIN